MEWPKEWKPLGPSDVFNKCGLKKMHTCPHSSCMMIVPAELFFRTVSKLFVMPEESQKRRLLKPKPKMTTASYHSNIFQSTSKGIKLTILETMPRKCLSGHVPTIWLVSANRAMQRD
jgi:hypothetical protein